MRFTLLLFFLFFHSAVFAEGSFRKVIFIAGVDSHGHGEHEFRAGCHLLAKCLNNSGLKVKATVIENGWPENEKKLDGADAIIIYSNGRANHAVKGHFKVLDSLTEKGVGVGFLHDACNVIPGDDSKYMSSWIGGYYERGFSTNPKWECKSKLNRQSPVANGVANFKLHDEWHFNIKFAENSKVQGVLLGTPDQAARSGATTSPRGPFQHIVDAAGKEEMLLWTNVNGKSRGFGFTGGHYHENWKNRNLRTLILNSIVWIAGMDVPKKGVQSRNPTKLEMSYRMSPSPEEIIWSKEIKNTQRAKLLFKSPVLKGQVKKSAINKSLDISEAKELILVALDGGNGINKDHCAWGNPELIFEDGSKQSLTELNWEVGITGWQEITIDRGIEREKMVIDGNEVKGIATHALSIIRYKLPAKVKQFNVLMGLLDSNANRGSVQFEVYVK